VKTEILPTHTAALFDTAVARAAELLRAGELVVLPTETVYGLAANAWNSEAVRRIFAAKCRPAENPVIVHVASLEMAKRCTLHWTEAADRLAKAFWPGPLTVVVPRSMEIPDTVTAGGATVGIRWPSHPFIQAVIRSCNFPLAAPSANRSSEVSPTNAAHALTSLGGRVSLIVDGGQSQVGIESTVIDVSQSPARVLRPGMIHEGSLAAALGEEPLRGAEADGVLRSPGLLRKHYAPKAKLVILRWRDEDDLARQVARFRTARDEIHIVAHSVIPLREKFGRVSVVPHDAEAFARALYAELRQCDEARAGLIVVEAPPAEPVWAAISDRLARASSE